MKIDAIELHRIGMRWSPRSALGSAATIAQQSSHLWVADGMCGAIRRYDVE